MGKLTPLVVRQATRPGLHADGAGLFLSVAPRAGGGLTKSWVVRFTSPETGRRREMGLGSVADIKLKDARARAKAIRDRAGEGEDPLEARQRRRQATAIAPETVRTFREVADEMITARTPTWKNDKHAAQWPQTMRDYVYPLIGDLAIDAVATADVKRVLDPIWTTKNETARRVRGRVYEVLKYATTLELRSGLNPARWDDHLDGVMPRISRKKRIKHHAALPYVEAPAFLERLRAADGRAAKALAFTMLTAARTGEVLGARWREIDFDAGIWTVPAERMKAGVEQRVPLSKQALELLGDVGERDGFVFAGPKKDAAMSNNAMLALLRRLGRSDITVHGLRSTFRDWAAERTAFGWEVAEAALAHARGDETAKAYQRGDLLEKRRRLTQAWADFCDTPLRADVVNFRRASQ